MRRAGLVAVTLLGGCFQFPIPGFLDDGGDSGQRGADAARVNDSDDLFLADRAADLSARADLHSVDLNADLGAAPDLSSSDLGTHPPDLAAAVEDLASRPLPDLASASRIDLADSSLKNQDLSRADDLSRRDLSRPDLEAPIDLRAPDLAAAHDLSTLPDAAVSPDLEPPSAFPFVQSRTLFGGTTAGEVVAADFNGDGNEDVMIANVAFESSFLFEKGNGLGDFTPAGSIGLPGLPVSGAIADFNRDGLLDVAALVYLSKIDLYPGVRNAFPTASGVAILPDYFATVMAIADFNRDDILDIVDSTPNGTSAGSVQIYLGTTSGAFTAGKTYAVGVKPQSMAIADFNNDGQADIAIACEGSGYVQILLGLGGGAFGPAQANLAVASGFDVNDVVATDLDRDGITDLLVANTTGDAVVRFLGETLFSGTFGAPLGYAAGPAPTHPLVFDVDGDGKLDVVAENAGAGAVSYLRGDGHGSFAAPISATFGVTAGAMATGDFNGDGRADLVVPSGANALVLENRTPIPTTPGFATAVSYMTGNTPDCLAVADFDLDGLLDVAVANSGDVTLTIFGGNGDGTLTDRGTVGAGNLPTGLAAGDLNRDGVPDLVVGQVGNNSVGVLLGAVKGGFPQNPSALYQAGGSVNAITLGDVDRDGIPDVVVGFGPSGNGAGSGGVSVLTGVGDGTLNAFASYTTTQSQDSMIAVALADLDRDGALDIVAIDDNNQDAMVLLGVGDGTYAKPVTYMVGFLPSGLAVGDWNGDGQLDLATPNDSGDDVSVLLGKGPGTFPSMDTEYSAGNHPRAIAAADLNLDGVLDLIIGNGDDSYIAVLYGGVGALSGKFTTSTTYSVGAGPVYIVVADFNQDGKPDIITANATDFTLSVLLNTAQ